MDLARGVAGLTARHRRVVHHAAADADAAQAPTMMARIKAWLVLAGILIVAIAGAAVWYAARLAARLHSTQRSLGVERAAGVRERAALDAFRRSTRDGEARREDIDAAAVATRAEVTSVRGRTLLAIAAWHDRARGR